jgi:hypothetical protein
VRRREYALRHRDRFGEKRLGGGPVAVLEQDPAVVGAALRIQERTSVPVDEALQRLNPLRRPLEIETAAAHDHRHAAHLGDRQRVVAFTTDDAGHRLVEERHALLGLALLHQGLPHGVHRHQLKVGVAAGPPDLGRLARQRLALRRVVRDVGGGAEELSAQLRNLVLDDPGGTGQPSAGGGGVAEVALVVTHEREGGAGREHGVGPAAEAGVGLLAVGDRAREVAQPEQRGRQPEERLGHLGRRQDSRKGIARAGPVAGRYGLEPSLDPALAHLSIVADHARLGTPHSGRWQTASTLLPSGSRTKAP